MLRYTFGLSKEADDVEAAVKSVLASGYRTLDIMSPGKEPLGTKEAGDQIAAAIGN